MIFLSRVLLFQALITLTFAAVPHISIFGGGKPAEPHQYPWVVGLGLKWSNTDAESGGEDLAHHCGASLLKIPGNDQESDIVLTAAHCIEFPIWVEVESHFRSVPGSVYIERDRIGLLFGNHRYSQDEKGEQKRGVVKMEYFPKWKEGFAVNGLGFDIAVLKLDYPVKFSETIRAIALPKKGDKLPAGTNCTVAGWGYTSGLNKSDELYHINVTIQDDNNCTKEWNAEEFNPKYDKEIMYCAGLGRGPTVCGGDSGSPLVCEQENQWVQFGITSFAPWPCGRENGPAAGYAKVEPFIEWIHEKIRAWSSVYPGLKRLKRFVV